MKRKVATFILRTKPSGVRELLKQALTSIRNPLNPKLLEEEAQASIRLKEM